MTLYLIILAVSLFLAEIAYIYIVRRWVPPLQKRTHPTGRTYTVNGAGIIFLPALASALLLPGTGEAYMLMALGATIVWVVSFTDDIHSLSPESRLIVHFIAAGMAMYYSIGYGIAAFIVALIALVALTNIYNFLDGIKGMLAWYSIVVLSSLIVVLHLIPELYSLEVYIPALAAMLVAVGIFAIFNVLLPDRVFSGDVGSIVMGFFLGWMLLAIIFVTGDIAYAALMMVYLIEGGITILLRLMRRENILHSHVNHIYQRLSRKGRSHGVISGGYALLQLVISGVFLLLPDAMDRQIWACCACVACLLIYAFLYVRTKSPSA